MTTIMKSIEVKGYLTHSGEPSCTKSMPDGEYCDFLRCKKMGQVFFCALDDRELEERDGFLVPTVRCRLWGGSQ